MKKIKEWADKATKWFDEQTPAVQKIVIFSIGFVVGAIIL